MNLFNNVRKFASKPGIPYFLHKIGTFIVVALIIAIALVAVQPVATHADVLDIIWYGASEQDVTEPGINDAFVHLQNSGLQAEKRERPISNLGDANLVVIVANTQSQFSSAEVTQIENFVDNGGRLILATNTDYFHCDPDSLCAMEVSRNFGFGFDGDVQLGTVTPDSGQSEHPIWTTPNHVPGFTNFCCDAYIRDILDTTNVKVLGRVSGESPELGEPTISVTNVPAIVVNENPTFNGGKVLGIGFNVFVGHDGDFRFFDNVISFMLIHNPNALQAAPGVVGIGQKLTLTQLLDIGGGLRGKLLSLQVLEADGDACSANGLPAFVPAAGLDKEYPTDFSLLAAGGDGVCDTMNIGVYTAVSEVEVNGVVSKSTVEFRTNFLLIPESPIGVAALIGSSLAALAGFVYLRRRGNSLSPPR